MIDFNRIDDQEIAKKVYEEAREFMGRCHFGSQGVGKTANDIKAACERVLKSGFKPIAFDTEMIWLPLAKKMLDGYCPLHAAVSYPMGRMTTLQKIKDLERLSKMGVTDTCVCLDWQAIFSHRWSDIEREARQIDEQTKNMFTYNAFIIPATLMSDTELIDVCSALDASGIRSIKINPGCKLGVSFEEVSLISRKFPGRFDLHPSGGIRTLEEVEAYLSLGCQVIHSVSSLDITEDFIKRQVGQYGGSIQ